MIGTGRPSVIPFSKERSSPLCLMLLIIHRTGLCLTGFHLL